MLRDKLLPWSELMAFGLGRLRLNPSEFWSMSLRELDAAIEGYVGKSSIVSAPQRNMLCELMTKHPDK